MTSFAFEPYYEPSVVPENDLVNGGTSDSSYTRRNLSENAVDEISFILKLEKAHYNPVYDYLAHNRAFPNADAYVTEQERRKMTEWFYSVVDHFMFDREVVSVAMNFLDRVSSTRAMETNGPISTSYFKFTAVAALYLAIKIHGNAEDVRTGEPRMLSIGEVIYLSRGVYTREQVVDKEYKILSALNWHVNPPTMLRFIAALLGFLPDSWGYVSADDSIANQIYETSRFLSEVIVAEPSCAFKFKASEIAYASILCSLDALQNKMPFPYEARLAFQDKVAAVTSMTPKSRHVRLVCFTLKRMDEFPYKSENLNIPMPSGGLSRSNSSNGGTSSPVAVCEPLDGVNNLTKIRDQKRTRLTYE